MLDSSVCGREGSTTLTVPSALPLVTSQGEVSILCPQGPLRGLRIFDGSYKLKPKKSNMKKIPENTIAWTILVDDTQLSTVTWPVFHRDMDNVPSHTHTPTPTLWHPSSPALCTREQPERCCPLCGSVVLWFCGAVDGAAALSRLSPMLGSVPAALPELGPGGQNSSGSLGSFLTVGRVQYCSPAGSPGKSWTQDGIFAVASKVP